VSARRDRRGGRAGRGADAHRSTDGSDETRWVAGRRRGSRRRACRRKWIGRARAGAKSENLAGDLRLRLYGFSVCRACRKKGR
jgi:hypothetical protein